MIISNYMIKIEIQHALTVQLWLNSLYDMPSIHSHASPRLDGSELSGHSWQNLF